MNRKTLILSVCFLHYLTALLLCLSPAPMGVTAVWALASVLGENRFMLAVFYAIAATLAMHRECSPVPMTGRSIFFYCPQGFLVIIAALGALVCIVSGHYADGVPRPVPFILRDQVIYAIMAFLYLMSIFSHR